MPSLKQRYIAVPSPESDKIPLRHYVDDPSSDDDNSDSGGDLRDRRLTKAGTTIVVGSLLGKRESRQPWQQLCCGLRFSKTCLIIILLLFGAVALIVLGGGGLYVYHTAPKDGYSPPWYPTPRGGTAGSWQKSYDKAKQMVERMTLVEKVNITTGIG